MIRRPPRSTLFPTRRSSDLKLYEYARKNLDVTIEKREVRIHKLNLLEEINVNEFSFITHVSKGTYIRSLAVDRKSTRLNSSHVRISYAVFCLKKKNRLA